MLEKTVSRCVCSFGASVVLRFFIAAGVSVLAVAIPSWSWAVTTNYLVDIQPLNNSGVHGTAFLTLIDTNTLTVNINATGLTPNQPHPQHIHGLPGGVNQSVLPSRTIPTMTALLKC